MIRKITQQFLQAKRTKVLSLRETCVANVNASTKRTLQVFHRKPEVFHRNIIHVENKRERNSRETKVNKLSLNSQSSQANQLYKLQSLTAVKAVVIFFVPPVERVQRVLNLSKILYHF